MSRRRPDILPLRRGHTLVIPKVHISRVSELPPEFAAATGEAVSKVANALANGEFQLIRHRGVLDFTWLKPLITLLSM